MWRAYVRVRVHTQSTINWVCSGLTDAPNPSRGPLRENNYPPDPPLVDPRFAADFALKARSLASTVGSPAAHVAAASRVDADHWPNSRQECRGPYHQTKPHRQSGVTRPQHAFGPHTVAPGGSSPERDAAALHMRAWECVTARVVIVGWDMQPHIGSSNARSVNRRRELLHTWVVFTLGGIRRG
jgi:hypothetical protein